MIEANAENNTLQWAKNIGERPFMVIVAQYDELINNETAGKAAIDMAKGPKEYIVVPDITHFEMYSGKPFEITKAKITDNNIQDVNVSYEKANEAEVGKVGYWLTLKGNPHDVQGAFRGRIMVYTNLPDEGPKLITFNGVVRADAAPTATSSTGQ